LGRVLDYEEGNLLVYDAEMTSYGDGLQGKHELRPDGDRRGMMGGPEKYSGMRAGMLIDPQGVTVFDTQGIDTFRMEMPACSSCGTIGRRAADGNGSCCAAAEQMRQAVLRWERMHCTDCGIRVWEGAIYCRECRPYGFWHWLAYFSPVAWRRIRADRSTVNTVGKKDDVRTVIDVGELDTGMATMAMNVEAKRNNG
jgi:hypothetical protein